MNDKNKEWTIELTDDIMEQMAADPTIAKAVNSFKAKVAEANQLFKDGKYSSMEEAMHALFPGMRQIEPEEIEDTEIREAVLNAANLEKKTRH